MGFCSHLEHEAGEGSPVDEIPEEWEICSQVNPSEDVEVAKNWEFLERRGIKTRSQQKESGQTDSSKKKGLWNDGY